MQRSGFIIAQLDDAIKSGSYQRRVNTLQRETDIFLHNGEMPGDDQIKLSSETADRTLQFWQVRGELEK